MKDRKKILLVDLANLCIRTGCTSYRKNPTDIRFINWKSDILRELASLIHETEANSVILCKEGKKNWRYEIYDEYKWDRKDRKAKSKLDFSIFFPVVDDFFDKLRKYVPNIYQLQVDCAEGDDLIAVLTKFFTPKKEVICVSNDRDFYQLLKYDGYRQYHPVKREFIHVINPERYLLEKVLVGDKGDCIPHIKPRVSKVTAAGIVDRGVEEWLAEEKEKDPKAGAQIEKNIERNKKLIDFDFIPAHVQNKIIEGVKNLKFSSMSTRDMSEFLLTVELGNMFDKIPEYTNTFIKLERIDV